MKAQFRILSGSRSSQVDVLSKAEIVLGRHPSCDLRFHPDQDLDVSGKHATIVKSGTSWVLKDLQSRNGTLLNGHRINADTRIDDTDQIQLGASGPKIEFRTVADSVADTAPPVFSHTPTAEQQPRTTGRHAPPSGAAPPPPVKAVASAGGSTTQRIRIEVAKQTTKFKWVTAALAAILVVAVGGVYLISQQQEKARESEVLSLRARTDSVVRAADEAMRALQGQMAGLGDALRQSQTQVQGLQTQLASAHASGDRSQVIELSRQLDDVSDRLKNQQVAAQVDYRKIFAANQHCVALVYVRFSDGTFTGTAFAVRPDCTMLTNRHVVAGADGARQALDVAIKFTDSPQMFGGRVLQISPDADLAVIRVRNLEGTVPTCHLTQESDPVQPGDPVATIGFPLGTSLPMLTQGEKTIAKATFTAGTVSKVLPDQVQIDGYGAEGASGSPYFDGKGDVVGVLHAGEPGTNGRVVYAVPVSEAIKLLQTIN